MERTAGQRADTGSVVYCTGFDLTPWQAERIGEVVVEYSTKPYQGHIIFVFKVNRQDLRAFEEVVDREAIRILRVEDVKSPAGA